MSDVLTKDQRRKCMAAIRGQDTKPEIALRKAVWHAGVRYRLHPKIPGRPDFVINRAKIAVFVDGCFWHGCPQHYQEPRTNSIFWKEKINRNIQRDLEINKMLAENGWSVLRFWEHEVKADLAGCVNKVLEIVTFQTGNDT